MHYFLLGLALLAGFLFLSKSFVNANPMELARNLRKIGGAGALLLALLLLLTGRFALAIPLAFFGFMLLGRSMSIPLPGGFNPGGRRKSAGQRSEVRTVFLAMTLDHDTGKMKGNVLKGRFRGRELAHLSLLRLLDLWRECAAQDQQSTLLMEAYLDHAHPEWREKLNDEEQQQSEQRTSSSGGGVMSIEEAYDILGLSPDASTEDIHRAHRSLMKQFHPDQGGSTYLAAKINEAKDMLLKSERG